MARSWQVKIVRREKEATPQCGLLETTARHPAHCLMKYRPQLLLGHIPHPKVRAKVVSGWRARLATASRRRTTTEATFRNFWRTLTIGFRCVSRPMLPPARHDVFHGLTVPMHRLKFRHFLELRPHSPLPVGDDVPRPRSRFSAVAINRLTFQCVEYESGLPTRQTDTVVCGSGSDVMIRLLWRHLGLCEAHTFLEPLRVLVGTSADARIRLHGPCCGQRHVPCLLLLCFRSLYARKSARAHARSV